jgi:putative MATE family efflux protein
MANLSIAAAAPRSPLQNPNIKRALEGSIPAVLLAFAAPSLVQMLVQSSVAVVEVLFLSRFGTDALAGISAVFPVVTLFVALTVVGMAGGVSSAIAQSLGAGKPREAEALAVHAIVLAVILGAISTAVVVGFGAQIYRALGAKGASLGQAVVYSNIVFGGAISLWLLGTLTAIVRGTGDMKSPARIAIARAAVAVPLFAILIFGWGPIPALGIVGAAIAMLIYYMLGVLGLIAHLQSSRSIIHLAPFSFALQWPLFARILKVAALSSAQLVVSNVVLIAITAYAARFGIEALAGYGLASRLELLISSLVLGFGVGTTTMVGICVGAGLVERARRVTLISCALAATLFGTLGMCVAVSGGWITRLFTNVEGIIFAGTAYFHAVGLVYGFLAISAMLFAAYQGWGRAVAPLFVGLLRLAVVLLGGWILLLQPGARLEWLFYLAAFSVVLAASVLGVVFLRWPPHPHQSGSFPFGGKSGR